MNGRLFTANDFRQPSTMGFLSMQTFRISKEWNSKAHTLFLEGKMQEAVNLALKEAGGKPGRFVQAAYYCFVLGDYGSALMFLKLYLKHFPRDIQILNNMTACCTRLHRYEEAVFHAQQVLLLDPDSFSAFDALAHALGKLGDMDGARKAGTKALLLKDLAALRHAPNTNPIPEEEVHEILHIAGTKKKVCAFSLFGSAPRYLRGALYNVLIGKELYPEWTMRFYMDGTVPRELKDALESLDAEVLEQEDDQPRDVKLCWRFLVASDPEVGRFMVRDCDSAFSLREVLVVDEWLESGKLFHVIHDWHTHTALVLAGLWGGVSGVLPDMLSMLDGFFASNRTITTNVDQFFLAQCVWPAIKESCLVHDRFFDAFSPRRPPLKHFRTRKDHIGADRFVTDKEWQDRCLAPWIRELPCLAVQMTRKREYKSGFDE